MRDKIKNLISEGKTKEAIDQILLLFEAESNKSAYDAILIIKSRYSQIHRKKVLNLASDESSQIELNRINDDVLNILNNPTQVSVLNDSQAKYVKKRMLAYILGTLFIFSLFIFAVRFIKAQKQSKDLTNFIQLDTREVNNRLENLKNSIIDFSNKDSSAAKLIAGSDLLNQIDTYIVRYNYLQQENIKAIERNDYLYSREVKKKINNLQLPTKINYENEIKWDIAGSDTSLNLPQIINFGNFLNSESYQIKLMVANSCGTGLSSSSFIASPVDSMFQVPLADTLRIDTVK